MRSAPPGVCYFGPYGLVDIAGVLPTGSGGRCLGGDLLRSKNGFWALESLLDGALPRLTGVFVDFDSNDLVDVVDGTVTGISVLTHFKGLTPHFSALGAAVVSAVS